MSNRRIWNRQNAPLVEFNTTGTSGSATVNNAAGDIIAGDYIHIGHYNAATGHISLFPEFVVADAAYNGGNSTRVGCFRGTRVAAIEAILKWKDDPDGKPVCWMSAPAGFGKSAVSQTVTESCARDETLAASFFFLRGAGGRSRIHHFITTLAYQITVAIPEVKLIVEMILQRDPTILSQSITYQLQNLIFVPFMVLAQTNTPSRALLIVVDALDECDDRNLMREFITALAHACHVGRHLRLRWLLTSRGEEHTRQSFSGTASQHATTVVQLDSFDARSDIKTFLEARFSEIIRINPRLFYGIPPPWPSLHDFWALVERSSRLFIFAATLVNFVTDGRAPPNRKLEIVLPRLGRVTRVTRRKNWTSQLSQHHGILPM
ncbi:hypothetical protein HWV62_9397 [Athelia sp. TMB]|nr:hypothetical protein HWV62_9397 [Athelia sp. TMB]